MAKPKLPKDVPPGTVMTEKRSVQGPPKKRKAKKSPVKKTG